MKLGLPALIVLAGATPISAQDAVRIIVHPSVPGTSVRTAALADIYLRRVAFWSGGQAIRAVDQSASSAVRARFSQMVFDQPTVWVTTYWSRQMTAGKGFPPAVKTSDEDVIAYVAKTKGAVGYVGAEATLDDTVKVLKLLESP